MLFARAAWLLILPSALAVLPQSFAAPLPTTSIIVRRVYFTPATPLEQIPLYSLDPAAPGALRGLEVEIERLYRHATTLPSGPDRRSFETRIYLLEKQLNPLAKSFDAVAWAKLREAVKSEWIAVQATLPSDPEPGVGGPATPAAGGAPLAALR